MFILMKKFGKFVNCTYIYDNDIFSDEHERERAFMTFAGLIYISKNSRGTRAENNE